ncbi:MAG: ABC transporter ATP-binding protein [Thermoanaerobaculia bacterium]|nr:ABC transporter ATP-binding protein [Thermoanaerobaculia bacterium]
MSQHDDRAAVELVDVRKHYDLGEQRVEVLRGVDLRIERGEAVTVMGPSGCGKSTLLHLIGTLDRPSSGDILYDGSSPWDLSEPKLAHFRNRRIGFVFQEAHLLPQYDVLENVLLPSLAFPEATDDAIEHRARELLERVGLAHRLDHRPAELSGGERQRVAVARALVNAPDLLLCDEPTGSLDAGTAAEIGDLLVEIHRERTLELVVVTHSEELARRFERRLELSEGRCYEA